MVTSKPTIVSLPLTKVSRTFRARKPVVKLQSPRFQKLIFQYVANVRKPERIAKYDGFQPRRCEYIKGIVAPEIGPKSFASFEKQAPGLFLD